jgi:hypothetical protein
LPHLVYHNANGGVEDSDGAIMAASFSEHRADRYQDPRVDPVSDGHAGVGVTHRRAHLSIPADHPHVTDPPGLRTLDSSALIYRQALKIQVADGLMITASKHRQASRHEVTF